MKLCLYGSFKKMGMRYKCIVPFVVILSFAAMGVRVQAADSASHTTTIAARIAPVIEVIKWPESLVELPEDIVPGVPKVVGPLGLEIRSNTPWVVKVQSGTPNGRLTQYDRRTATYVASGAQMSIPVCWGLATGGPWNAVDTTETPVTGGQSTGEAGAKVNLYLKVEATFDDPVLLEEDHEYRMDLSYIVSVTY